MPEIRRESRRPEDAAEQLKRQNEEEFEWAKKMNKRISASRGEQRKREDQEAA